MDGQPQCLRYRLNIDIATANVVNPACLAAIPLPSSFDNLGWRNEDGSMHFVAEFAIPKTTAYRYGLLIV